MALSTPGYEVHWGWRLDHTTCTDINCNDAPFPTYTSWLSSVRAGTTTGTVWAKQSMAW